MKKTLLSAIAFISVLLLVPELVNAQYYQPQRPQRPRYRQATSLNRPHVYLGGYLMGIGVANTVTDYEPGGFLGAGGGGGMFVGFRASPFLAVEISGFLTMHDESYDNAYADVNAYYLFNIEANGKLIIPTYGPLEPYVQVGIGYASAGTTYEDSYGHTTTDEPLANGPSFNIGGGVDFYPIPNFSLGARLLYRGFYFSDADLYEDNYVNFVSGFSLDLNAAFHF